MPNAASAPAKESNSEATRSEALRQNDRANRTTPLRASTPPMQSATTGGSQIMLATNPPINSRAIRVVQAADWRYAFRSMSTGQSDHIPNFDATTKWGARRLQSMDDGAKDEEGKRHEARLVDRLFACTH